MDGTPHTTQSSESSKKPYSENKKLLYAVLLWILILLVGGGVFYALEFNANERIVDKQVRHLEEVKRYFQHNKTVLAYLQKHYTVFDESTFSHRWTFSGSVFFSFTVCTTIGYGDSSPKTFFGQLFVVVFSIISIPMAGTVLFFASDRALHSLKVVYVYLKNEYKYVS